jgi:hypothetical protein
VTLKEAYVTNERTRSSVTSWIDRADWEAPPSFFNYGLPHWAYPWVNLPVGAHPVGHDLISFLGAQLRSPRRLHYLEVGVSVGKCLFTQLQFFGKGALVMAFDLEEINPAFERLLTPAKPPVLASWTEERLRPGVNTQRRVPGHEHVDTIKAFTSPAGGELRYLSSDEFNAVGWEHLQKQGIAFDLIYSDALHTPDALLFEATQLLERGLINHKQFAFVWDDCEGTMVEGAVCPILAQLRKVPGAPPVHFNIFKIGGWMGDNEAKHHTCVATTLDLSALRKGDAALAALERVSACGA